MQEKLEELRFNVARSIRYHDKRRGFFEMLGKGFQFVALLGSCGHSTFFEPFPWQCV